MPSANPIIEQMPLLARNAGVWVGTYTHITPDRTVLDEHNFRISVEIPEDGVPQYRQTSEYTWEDGRNQHFVYEGFFMDGALSFEDERIRGRLIEVDDFSLYLRFSYQAKPDHCITELIHLSPDGRQRSRVWQWFEGDKLTKLTKLTLVKENREPAQSRQGGFRFRRRGPPVSPGRP